eukprot:scaffold607837_cov29-Prasinocladus_malaysianus.AAC.1
MNTNNNAVAGKLWTMLLSQGGLPQKETSQRWPAECASFRTSGWSPPWQRHTLAPGYAHHTEMKNGASAALGRSPRGPFCSLTPSNDHAKMQ